MGLWEYVRFCKKQKIVEFESDDGSILKSLAKRVEELKTQG